MLPNLVRLILYAIAAIFIYRFLRTVYAQYRRSHGLDKNKVYVELDKKPHEILGVEPNADFEEIQKAYKAALSKYHPDKVSHLGKEIQNLAKRKTAQIIAAYEEMKRTNGPA